MNQPGELSEKNGLGFLAALQEPEPWGWDTAWYEVVCILYIVYYAFSTTLTAQKT